MRVIILILSLGLPSYAFAEDKTCEAQLSAMAKQRAKFEVIPSDRVPGEAEKFAEYGRELTQPGGVLDELGIEMTGQIVQFLPGRELNALTSGTAGGYPVAHPLDGAAVLRALRPSGGFALEVVYPGPQFQHGYYRDDNPTAQQMSIIDHVVGHNHFALKSGFPHYRVAQGLLATRELDELLHDLYKKFNKDEVQRFYLWALTLMRMVDWHTPYYEPSEKFEPKLEMGAADLLNRVKPEVRRHPKATTENILAAFAGNIAAHEPPWKRKMLELIAQSMAFRPALVHTQILNEGWASIMQEIIPQHTKGHHNFTFWFQAHQVMQREGKPKLQDPYSLGVFCWRRLKERFEERPEILALKTQKEKDRAFIKYAETEIIGRMDDSQFLRLAMDQIFIDRYKLAIIRKAKEHEQDSNLPPPKAAKEPVAQWIIVSRDAEKVAQQVIDLVLKPKYMMNPRVKLVDFNRPQSGEVEMVMNDPVANELALEKSTLAPSLFAMSQFIGKPVSLDCNIAVETSVEVDEEPDMFFGMPFHMPPTKRTEVSQSLARIRITVSPTGDVRVYKVAKQKRDPIPLRAPDARTMEDEVFDQELTNQFALYMRVYLDDLYLDDAKEMDKLLRSSPQLRALQAQMVAAAIDNTPMSTLMEHSPNSAGAIAEYKAAVERRILRAMELAAQGKGKMKLVGGNVRVKALPSAVNIQFDSDFAESVLKGKAGAPVDSLGLIRSAFGDFQGGEGSVGGLDGRTGDRFWGPDNRGGQGEGPGGRKPGEDPEDLSWVDIPQDLYSKFLGERVKLPNLSKKPGQSRVPKMKPGGRINRIQGQILPTEMQHNIQNRGIAEMLARGEDPFADLNEAFNAGLEVMQPRDWVVKNRKPTRKPEVKAVVTFVLDGSGSVGKYLEAFKNFVHDVETLVQANYKGFAFRYILFDTEAHLLKDKNALFRAELGGGTMYEKGLEKARWLHEEEYPRATWDRFTFLMGDMEDFDVQKAIAKIKQLMDESEFVGVVAGVRNPEWIAGLELLQWSVSEAPNNPKLGVTVLNPDGSYELKHIKEVLKNEDEK